MLVKNTAQSPHKISTKNSKPNPNYSPKSVIKPAVCNESNHHDVIVVAVFVQHTTDLAFYKATSSIQNNNR